MFKSLIWVFVFVLAAAIYAPLINRAYAVPLDECWNRYGRFSKECDPKSRTDLESRVPKTKQKTEDCEQYDERAKEMIRQFRKHDNLALRQDYLLESIAQSLFYQNCLAQSR